LAAQFGKWFVGIHGPGHRQAQQTLLKEARHFSGVTVTSYFAALLAGMDNVRDDSLAAPNALAKMRANGLAAGMSRKNAAEEARVLGIKRSNFRDGLAENLLRRAAALNSPPRALEIGHALVAESRQNVLLAGEIIEERPFADIRRLGDVLHGCGQITAFGKKPQGGLEKAVARLVGASRSAGRTLHGLLHIIAPQCQKYDH